MRKTANVKNHSRVKRVMVYESSAGVYLFEYDTLADGAARADVWFATLADAERVCVLEFGIQAEHWEPVNDPLEGCQRDWIAPVRVKGRNKGKPEWGVLERLEDGIWRKVE